MLKYVNITSAPKKPPDFIEHDYFGIKTCGGFKHYTEYEIGLGRLLEELHCILGSLVRSKYKMENMKYEMAHILEENALLKRDLKEYSRDLYFERFNKKDEYSIKSRQSILDACATMGRYVIKTKRELDFAYEDDDAFWVPLAKACLHMASVIYVIAAENLNDNKHIFQSSEIHRRYQYVEEAVADLRKQVEKHNAK